MLYLYDNAIVDDLVESFNVFEVGDPVVKVIPPEDVIGIAAQIQNDHIKFPIIAVNRNPDTPIDRTRTNFTRMHKGVAAVFDDEKNEFYHEKAIPIELRYALTILATNTADLDEIVRELMFKYMEMYFLSIKLPYEADRQVRFGVTLDPDSGIERSSGTSEYLQQGSLYQAIVPLKCEGCALVHYTPVKLRRTEYEVVTVSKGEEE